MCLFTNVLAFDQAQPHGCGCVIYPRDPTHIAFCRSPGSCIHRYHEIEHRAGLCNGSVCSRLSHQDHPHGWNPNTGRLDGALPLRDQITAKDATYEDKRSHCREHKTPGAPRIENVTWIPVHPGSCTYVVTTDQLPELHYRADLLRHAKQLEVLMPGWAVGLKHDVIKKPKSTKGAAAQPKGEGKKRPAQTEVSKAPKKRAKKTGTKANPSTTAVMPQQIVIDLTQDKQDATQARPAMVPEHPAQRQPAQPAMATGYPMHWQQVQPPMAPGNPMQWHPAPDQHTNVPFFSANHMAQPAVPPHYQAGPRMAMNSSFWPALSQQQQFVTPDWLQPAQMPPPQIQNVDHVRPAFPPDYPVPPPNKLNQEVYQPYMVIQEFQVPAASPIPANENPWDFGIDWEGGQGAPVAADQNQEKPIQNQVVMDENLDTGLENRAGPDGNQAAVNENQGADAEFLSFLERSRDVDLFQFLGDEMPNIDVGNQVAATENHLVGDDIAAPIDDNQAASNGNQDAADAIRPAGDDIRATAGDNGDASTGGTDESDEVDSLFTGPAPDWDDADSPPTTEERDDRAALEQGSQDEVGEDARPDEAPRDDVDAFWRDMDAEFDGPGDEAPQEEAAGDGSRAQPIDIDTDVEPPAPAPAIDAAHMLAGAQDGGNPNKMAAAAAAARKRTKAEEKAMAAAERKARAEANKAEKEARRAAAEEKRRAKVEEKERRQGKLMKTVSAATSGNQAGRRGLATQSATGVNKVNEAAGRQLGGTRTTWMV